MAAVSEPVSPPAAKRARLDPDTQFSTLPPSPQSQANGHGNGETNGSKHESTTAPPEVSSIPSFEATAQKVEKNVDDYESDDEDVPEQPTAEAEDHSRQDMYLDTVSRSHWSFHSRKVQADGQRYHDRSLISTLSGCAQRA